VFVVPVVGLCAAVHPLAARRVNGVRIARICGLLIAGRSDEPRLVALLIGATGVVDVSRLF